MRSYACCYLALSVCGADYQESAMEFRHDAIAQNLKTLASRMTVGQNGPKAGTGRTANHDRD